MVLKCSPGTVVVAAVFVVVAVVLKCSPGTVVVAAVLSLDGSVSVAYLDCPYWDFPYPFQSALRDSPIEEEQSHGPESLEGLKMRVRVRVRVMPENHWRT